MRSSYPAATIAAIAVVLQSVAHLLNVLVLDRRANSIDVNAEMSLASWLGSSATFAAALGAAALAWVHPPRRVALAALSALLLVLSLDDAAALHERSSVSIVDAFEGRHAYVRLVWPVLLAPVLVASFVLLVRAHDLVPVRQRRMLHTGLACLGAGVVAEVLGLALHIDADRVDTAADDAQVLVEEGLELAGWILVASALVAGLRRPWPAVRR